MGKKIKQFKDSCFYNFIETAILYIFLFYLTKIISNSPFPTIITVSSLLKEPISKSALSTVHVLNNLIVLSGLITMITPLVLGVKNFALAIHLVQFISNL